VTLNVGDLLEIVGGSTVSVFQGSDETAANLNLAIGGSGGTMATMVVDGVGSTLAASMLTRLGSGASTGTLTFQNGSTGNSLSGTVNLMANSFDAGSTGRLNVLSGSPLKTPPRSTSAARTTLIRVPLSTFSRTQTSPPPGL
jgi:hypothetical protein